MSARTRANAGATHRPAALSGALAVAAAAVAAWQTSPGDAAAVPLLVVVAGVAALAGGAVLRGRGRSALGWVALAAGVACLAAGVGLGFVRASGVSARLRLLPGLVGVALVGAGVAPLRGAGSRRLCKAGAVAAFLGVLAASVVAHLGAGPALAATAGAVLAWDFGEHAVGVGEQLGRDAGTLPAEFAHGVGSLLAGGVAVFAGRAVTGVGPSGLSLPALVLLLASVVALSLALHG